jgi:uncharacterized protein (DUF2236 family)
MEFQPSSGSGSLVSRDDIEALLAAVAGRVADPAAGLFGPASVSWKINREAALFLGAGRAALLQLAHPWVAESLARHSTLMRRPIARFHGTFRIVFTMIFGSLDQALAAARHLYALHTRIRGTLPEDIAGYKRGSHYEANEISALRWVYATLVESAVVAYECVLPPLTAAERERYYAESKIMAALFGIPAAALPEDWDAFLVYNRQMHESNALGVSPGARRMAQGLLRGAGSWIHPPHWYRAVTAAWLPARFRDEFALELGKADQRAAERALHRLSGLYRRLPQPLRFAGPWQEAQARLARRPVGAAARWSNRFWIGQPLLPFRGAAENPLRA